jgi:hypothetical protein
MNKVWLELRTIALISRSNYRVMFIFIVQIVCATYAKPTKGHDVVNRIKGRLILETNSNNILKEILEYNFLISAMTTDRKWHAFYCGKNGTTFDLKYAEPLNSDIIRLGFTKFGFDTVSISLKGVDYSDSLKIIIRPTWNNVIGSLYISPDSSWFQKSSSFETENYFHKRVERYFFQFDSTLHDTIEWGYDCLLPQITKPRIYHLERKNLSNYNQILFTDCNSGNVKFSIEPGRGYLKVFESSCVTAQFIQLIERDSVHFGRFNEKPFNCTWQLNVIKLR